MPFLPSLDDQDGIPHAFARYNIGTEKHIIQLLQKVLRDHESQLTIAEKELIAFYVSLVNKCNYCAEAHAQAAIQFGAKPKDIVQIKRSILAPEVEDRLRSILEFLYKTLTNPTNASQQEMSSVMLHGWEEDTLYHATMIASVITMVNTLANGIGLETDRQKAAFEGRMLRSGYEIMIKQFSLS